MRKKIIAVALIYALFTTAVAGIAATAETPNVAGGSVNPREGRYSSSEEVIYAILDGDGSPRDVWVVGTLNVESGGNVTVYGDFTKLKNLTTTRAIDYMHGTLTMNADEGRFYWQGALARNELPWEVSITYKLNGSEATAAQLAGANGKFDLRITTDQNKSFDAVFFENYMLQVTVTLDTAKCSNITADGATVANAGSKKTLVYTVMPGSDGLIELSADVTNFELESISLAAVPYSIDVDLGDLSGYTSDFKKLSNAISDLNDGVKELRDGANTLSDGASRLGSGSDDYNSGLSQIAAGSDQLRSGSESIVMALGGLESGDMSSFSQLPVALRQIVAGLDEISETLKTLSGGYSQSLEALNAAISAIPDESLSEADIYTISASNPGNKTIEALIANYQAAQTVKGTYAVVSEALTGVQAALPVLASGISELSGGLTETAAQIESGLGGSGGGFDDLAAQYIQFHNGLVAYIDGVSALAGGYAQIHSGIAEFAAGTSEFSSGMDELADGVNELNNETSQLPGKIDDMADEMISDYMGGNFEIVSFLSDKNENVELVQFVFRTDAITLPKDTAVVDSAPVQTNFWTRLLDLFR